MKRGWRPARSLARVRAIAVIAIVALTAACETRIVNLRLPANLPPEGGDATVVDARAEAGVPPSSEACKIVLTDDTRCLSCQLASGQTSMACLKCDPPIRTSDTGDYCRTCGWTDLRGQCLQCFDPAGTPALDDCDSLRAPAASDGAP